MCIEGVDEKNTVSVRKQHCNSATYTFNHGQWRAAPQTKYNQYLNQA